MVSKTLAAGAIAASLTIPLQAQSYYSADRSVNEMSGFGLAVAVGENEIIVGEAANTYVSGAVFVYRPGSDGAWVEEQRITASDAEWGDGFGTTVAVDGNSMLVGDGNGKVYSFQKRGSSWAQTGVLMAEDGMDGDGFGLDARISGNYAFIGSNFHSDSTGAVYVYQNNGGRWSFHSKLTASDGGPGDRFGNAIALDGDHAIITARGHSDGKGTAYAYRLVDGSWRETGKVEPRGLTDDAEYAFAADMENGRAVLGALNMYNERGVSFVFTYNDEEEEWQQTSALQAFDADVFWRFGRSVAIAGSDLLIAAPGAANFSGILYQVHSDGEGGFTGATAITADVGAGDYSAAYLDANDRFGVMGMRGQGGAFVLAPGSDGRWGVVQKLESQTVDGLDPIAGAMVPCADGSAQVFDCDDMDMVSFLPVSSLGGGSGINVNDVWGWEDPVTGREWALVGRTDGTAFVDITDPANPIYVGQLMRTPGTPVSTWRDIKVYNNHAYIVADGSPNHGMQVFDLTRLRDVRNAPVSFEPTALYDRVGSSHNVVINEETGFAYAVGVSGGGETCGGGLHMIDIRNPAEPTFAGCFSDPETGNAGTGYSHDAMCIIYNGPDADYQGKEMCFGSNETALSIADVTDKQNPVAVSMATYPNVGYAHQGWITEDHRFFYMNDELDELQHESVNRTRTLIFDVTDLDDPVLLKEHYGTQESSDHNLYIRDNLMYQSNYQSGLRVLDISDPGNPVEVGYFDTVPIGDNSAGMGGSWSNYPFFTSGTVIVTSGQEGLFMLRKKENLVP